MMIDKRVLVLPTVMALACATVSAGTLTRVSLALVSLLSPANAEV